MGLLAHKVGVHKIKIVILDTFENGLFFAYMFSIIGKNLIQTRAHCNFVVLFLIIRF